MNQQTPEYAELVPIRWEALQLDALEKFVAQRSGIEVHNYANRESFMYDYRKILRHGAQARKMLKYLQWRSIPSYLLTEAARATSGRLEYDYISRKWSYNAGQDYCTEYRAAVCNLLAQAIEDLWRLDERIFWTRSQILVKARKQFGRAIARDWFV